VFQGRLVLKTALHLGGGRLDLTSTDAPLIRTPGGEPFIPGSSIKGVFRSTVEKLVGVLPGVKSCMLASDNEWGCIGPRGETQRAFHNKRQKENWSEKEYLAQLDQRLCHTCKLFGSPFMVSRIFFDDLYLMDRDLTATQIRDGVGIDRDSEKAVDRVKFDYEVVAAGAEFLLRITVDNPTEVDLALIAAGLMELQNNFVRLGGKKSSGLGSCQLTDLNIHFLDLGIPQGEILEEKAEDMLKRLKKYLLGSSLEKKMTSVTDVPKFLGEKIEFLFREGFLDAQKIS